MDEKQRTLRQNRAAHKWFKEAADTLNAHGADMQVVLSKRMGIWWSGDSFKEALFKGLAKAAFDVESSTQLNSRQFSQVVEMLSDVIAKDNGVVLPPFPSIESQINEERVKHDSNSNQ